jgi:DNA ligase (NAD+)
MRVAVYLPGVSETKTQNVALSASLRVGGERNNFNFDLASKHPQRYANSLTVPELVSLLQHLDMQYHNAGGSPVADDSYDTLRDVLSLRAPNHPYLKHVGSPYYVSQVKDRVSLPYYMPSLSKIKPNTPEATRWYAAAPKVKQWLVSDKLDGVSLLLVYSRGSVSAFTRGDGSVGQDVTAIVPHLRGIPPAASVAGKLVVRGEVIIKRAIFETKYAKHSSEPTIGQGTYATGRNMVVGLVNRITSHDSLKDLQFVAYELIDPAQQKPSDQMAYLKELGFMVVAHKVINAISDEALSRMLESRRVKCPFDVDGLVVARDVPYIRTNSDRPIYAMAFKDNSLMDQKYATVKDVVWEITRTGLLAPRVIVNTINLGGANITAFTAFNAFFIEHGYAYKDRNLPANAGKKFPIGPGAKILGVRSGEVIPYIVKVVTPASEPKMPDFAYTYDANGINISPVVGGGSNHRRQQSINVFLHFFRTIGALNVGEGFVSKAIDAGYTQMPALLRLSAADYASKFGLSPLMANKLYNSIHGALDQADLALLGDATGIFGRGVGRTKLTDLLAAIPNLMGIPIESALDINRLSGRIVALPGFSTTTATQIITALPRFKKFVQAANLKSTVTAPKPAATSELQDIKVVFSKVRDKATEADITARGGQVVNSVRDGVTHLIVGALDNESTKIDKARDRGIQILTLAQFRSRYL